MRMLTAALLLAATPVAGQVIPGHRLPEGARQRVRERQADLQHVRGQLRFDMVDESL